MNHFDVKANQIERAFFRKYQSDYEYFTGTGKRNKLDRVTNRTVYVKSMTGEHPQPISRRRLRKAMSYLLYKRTATRRELQKFAELNSSLMGLLQMIFAGIAKIHQTAKRLLRITIKGVRFFFSGLDRATDQDWEAIIQSGAKFILCSYYYLRKEKMDRLIYYLQKYDLQLLLDSGEFSAYKARRNGKKISPIRLQALASFIRTYSPYIYGYFNMDVTGNPERSKANYLKLRKLTGRSPIPIWHCNVDNWEESDWEALDQLVSEDHAIIGIGATVAMGLKAGPKLSNQVKDRLFGEIFRRYPLQNFHWLGGSSKILFKYPIFSCDSTGYLQGRKKHQVYYFDGNDISTEIKRKWQPLQCLIENVRILSGLEDLYINQYIESSTT